MKKLIIFSTKLSYYILLFLTLPLILEANTIIKFWLGTLPEYAVVFVQLTLIHKLFSVFDGSLFYGLYAIGRIKENSIISTLFVGIWLVPISYVLFRLHCSPVIVYVVSICMAIILSFIVKPILLYKYVWFSMKDLKEVFWPCISVTVISALPPLLFYIILASSAHRFFIVLLSSWASSLLAAFYFGIEKSARAGIIVAVKEKMPFIHN